MINYHKPWYYILIHVIIGFVAAWYPILIVLAVAYQLGQLMCNVRVFLIEGTIEEGNSIYHTSKKLSEYTIGYLIGYIVKSTKKLEEAIQP